MCGKLIFNLINSSHGLSSGLFSVRSSRAGHCRDGRPRPSHRERDRGIWEQGGGSEGSGALQRGSFAADHVWSKNLNVSAFDWTFPDPDSSVCRTPCPVIVEPLEHLDDEDGLPEKLLQKTPKYHK